MRYHDMAFDELHDLILKVIPENAGTVGKFSLAQDSKISL